MEQPTQADIKVINTQITALTDTIKEFKVEQKESLNDIRETIRDLSNTYVSKEKALNLELQIANNGNRIKILEDRGWWFVASLLGALGSVLLSAYQYFIQGGK